jgi:hypothetical protein
VALGVGKAYVVPFFKRRSLGWSIGTARNALINLARDPRNPVWQVEARDALATVQRKKDSLPALGAGQATRFRLLSNMARMVSRSPGLSGLADALR